MQKPETPSIDAFRLTDELFHSIETSITAAKAKLTSSKTSKAPDALRISQKMPYNILSAHYEAGNWFKVTTEANRLGRRVWTKNREVWAWVALAHAMQEDNEIAFVWAFENYKELPLEPAYYAVFALICREHNRFTEALQWLKLAALTGSEVSRHILELEMSLKRELQTCTFNLDPNIRLLSVCR